MQPTPSTSAALEDPPASSAKKLAKRKPRCSILRCVVLTCCLVIAGIGGACGVIFGMAAARATETKVRAPATMVNDSDAIGSSGWGQRYGTVVDLAELGSGDRGCDGGPRENRTVDVTFRITGFRSADALCKVWISTHERTFMDGDDAWAVSSHSVDPDTLECAIVALDVPSADSGSVAAFVVHDADGSGYMTANGIGFPMEGVTATRGARGGPFGGPYWKDAKVSIGDEPCIELELAMWYP